MQITSARRLQILIISLAVSTELAASPLFSEMAPLEITLTGPLDSVIESGDERAEFPFTLTVEDTNLPLEVRTRGKSRLRVCKFPPLRLNFEKSATGETAFAGQDKVKLVTHCSDKRTDKNALLDEYVAYRIFQQVSEFAYRVRMANVRYVDTDDPNATPVEQQGFLIESDEVFAERTGGEIRELPGVVYSHLDDEQATLVYVFQYLIGNTDWSLVTADGDDTCCHNGDLFEINGKIVLVPYDFDLAGIVDASYARPDPSLRIRGVRSRVYRGYCTSPETVRSSLHKIVAARGVIMQVVSDTPASSPKDLESRIEYVEKFYEEAGDEDKLMRNFERRCLD